MQSLKGFKPLFPLKSRSNQSISKSQKTVVSKEPENIFKTEYSSKLHLFLFLLYSGTSVNVIIPPSYILLKQAQRRALYYHAEGELHMENEESSLDHFFEITKETEIKKYRQPKFILFVKDKTLLCADEAEARENMRTHKTDFCLLQKYVCSNAKYSKKIRVF